MNIANRFLYLNFIFIISLLLLVNTFGQQANKVIYLYDDNGRLSAVIAQNGEAVVYEYDAAGNFTAIKRFPSNELSIIAFLPRQGPIGTRVTIYGTGFVDVTGVTFNGVSAQIIETNSSVIVAEVPVNATTGPISVLTSTDSAASANPFIVRGVRINPRSITITANEMISFSATVSGLASTNVIWSVNGIPGGNTTNGTISTSGIYKAPNLVNAPTTQYTVRATSNDDSTLFDEAVVNVLSVREGYQFITDGVSVRYGTPPNKVSTFAQDGVSIRYGTPPNAVSTFPNNAVSVGSGPFVTSVSPGTVSRGSTVVLNINGILLDDASNIVFFRVSNGAAESGITVSNINVNSQATILSATLTVNGSVAVGQFVVIVVTPSGATVRSKNNLNIIQVQ